MFVCWLQVLSAQVSLRCIHVNRISRADAVIIGLACSHACFNSGYWVLVMLISLFFVCLASFRISGG